MHVWRTVSLLQYQNQKRSASHRPLTTFKLALDLLQAGSQVTPEQAEVLEEAEVRETLLEAVRTTVVIDCTM